MMTDQPHQAFMCTRLSGHLGAPFCMPGGNHDPNPQTAWLILSPLLEFRGHYFFYNHRECPLPRAEGIARFADIMQQAGFQQARVVMAKGDQPIIHPDSMGLLERQHLGEKFEQRRGQHSLGSGKTFLSRCLTPGSLELPQPVKEIAQT